MSIACYRSFFIAIAALTCLAGKAQFQSVKEDEIKIDVKNVDLRILQFDDNFPNLEGFSSGGRDKWLRIIISYELALNSGAERRYERDEAWLDRLDVSWSVILAPVARGNSYDDRKAVRLDKEISYANVKVGEKRYYAMAFVEPSVIERYTGGRISADDIFSRVYFRVGGKTIQELGAKGKDFTTSSRDISDSKYAGRGRRGSLFESEEVVRPAMGLLNRLETPWEWSSYDNFEPIIQNSLPGLLRR